MKKCDKCGTNNPDKARYCVNCGYELPKREEAAKPETESVSEKNRKVKKQKATAKNLIIWIICFVVAYGLSYWGVQQLFFKNRKTDFNKTLLYDAARKINQSCPVMIDTETRLDSVAVHADIFQYDYTLMNKEKENLDTLKIKTGLEPTIFHFVKTDSQMKALRKNKITIKYYYRDRNENYAFQISVKPES